MDELNFGRTYSEWKSEEYQSIITAVGTFVVCMCIVFEHFWVSARKNGFVKKSP